MVKEQSGKKFNNLQGLRFFAWILIFLNHSYWYLSKNKLFEYGGIGVEIFFILSGFLVAYNYKNKLLDSSFKGCFYFLIIKLFAAKGKEKVCAILHPYCVSYVCGIAIIDFG